MTKSEPGKVQDLQARITELENKGKRGPKTRVLSKLTVCGKGTRNARISKEKVSCKLSDKGSIKQSRVSQPKGGSEDELSMSVTADQSSVQEAMVANLRGLRRKYDRAGETIDEVKRRREKFILSSIHSSFLYYSKICTKTYLFFSTLIVLSIHQFSVLSIHFFHFYSFSFL